MNRNGQPLAIDPPAAGALRPRRRVDALAPCRWPRPPLARARTIARGVVSLLACSALAPWPAALGQSGSNLSPAGGPRSVEQQRQARAYELYLDAYEATATGRAELAQSLLEELLEIDPGAARAHSMLARLCLRRGDLACAETEAQRAVALSEDDADGQKVLAEIALNRYRSRSEQADLDSAVAHLRAAVGAEPHDASLWTFLVRVLGSEGRFEEAEAEARRAAATPGIDPAKPWLALARTLLSRGETERAVRLLEGLDLRGHTAIPLLRMLADLKGSQEDLAGQVEVLQRLWSLRPEDAEVAHRLGLGLLGLGDPFAALGPLQSAEAERPGDPIIRRDLARTLVALGRGSAALEKLDGLPEVYLSPHTLVLWAQAAEQAGRFAIAAEKLQTVIAALEGSDEASFSPAFRLRAARNWLRAGRGRQALAVLEGLGDDVTVLRLRLDALRAEGRLEEAERLLEKMTADDPHNPGLVAHRADRLAGDGRDDEALSLLLEGHAGARDQEAMLAGLVRWLVGWDRGALAARLVDALGLGDDPDPASLRLRAVALNAAGRDGEAEAAYRALLDLDPDDDAVLNELGYLLATKGRSLEEAVRLLERAVAINPDEPAYLDSLGWALHRAGSSTAALPLLQRALRSADDSQIGVIREHLGDVYLALGDSRRALAEWGAALTFGGEDRDRLQRKIETLTTETPRP